MCPKDSISKEFNRTYEKFQFTNRTSFNKSPIEIRTTKLFEVHNIPEFFQLRDEMN
jgi:hypothetical protein